MLPDPEYFGIFYHEAYKVLPSQLKKKIDWNKLKKKLTKFRNKPRNKIDVFYDNDTNVPPEIELPGNASAFAVFASIRLAVLDRWMHHASEEYLHSSYSAPIQDAEIESDTEDNSQSCCHHSVKISKVVGLGLRSVFELIRESRISHPTLCSKALLALLNVLQGQSPEGLKSEPSEVIDPLFDLLLDLATLHGPESSVPNDGTHLTAIACTCLLSLIIVRGDTGKFLSATAALLMCPRALALQNIKMSTVLCSLQRSVYGVLLEKNIRPDWITHGVLDNSVIDSFCLKLPNELSGKQIIMKALACDGCYFYLFSSKGLFKIGSGFGGTIKGHIMLWKPDFYPNDNGVLVHCGGKIYLKLSGRHNGEILTVDKNSLLVTGSILLHNKDASSSIIFSDGDYLGIISPGKDDSFVVRTLNQNISPAPVINELPLKLVKKCIEVFGTAFFEEETGNCSFNVENEEEVAAMAFGKEFGLLRTFTGKVLYCGKSSALGIKQSGVRTGKWCELNLTKSPKINHLAVGHDGLHAILITEDGSVFFTGTARRGEDGDQSKVRRQVKPVKPKKMIKIEDHHIVGGACNNGTTALINSNGELILFGKDTAHTDPATGIVTSLKGTVIVQVVLGKAHGMVLTNKGHVYTFGINNKYQCGRDFMLSKDEHVSHVTAMETCGVQEECDFCNETNVPNECSAVSEAGENLADSIQNICPPGMHSWHDDMCMICSVCRECTGYSVNCLSSISSERNPGQECGCGEGDSGCSICGCCRICAHEVVDNSDFANLSEMIKFNLTNDKISVPQKCKVQEQIQWRLDAKKCKSKKSVQLSKQPMKSKFPRSTSNSASTTTKIDSVKQSSTVGIAKDQSGSDVERDATKITCLPPAKISLPSDSPVVQIACGLHHSMVLLRNGQVNSFYRINFSFY
ncbi:E3 ubiquitin-protein ligase MYCBP2-like [Anoplophora glabripennis]|uniref:E3 ubiquitin-protein ligase MYCBP2-like n=1 Tax=Anoplophora glabripennis TaxID=217634 RepID=UPI0008747B2E|nr:E3 ubiquitin-protein ligase MYCBP2-like [Anoplophora glabripennis]